MNHPLFYVSYYDTETNAEEQRYYVPSAVGKMTYICSAINRAGFDVRIVSASGSLANRRCPAKTIPLFDRTELKLFSSIGSGPKLKRLLHRIHMQSQLFFYLLKHTKKGQPVIVYHSVGYDKTIRFAKKLKNFRLILEVEEIYADVSENRQQREREFKMFDSADAYIFPTELLNAAVNTTGKPYVVVSGTYQQEEPRGCSFSDDKIHLLYAGTFDPRKGGAQAAATAATKLSEQYHIHILGFGSPKEEQDMRALIEDISAQSKATVTYDGRLGGEAYIRFLQSCHAGFSTQTPQGVYNETSFPSKVLSYLANGLRVVSIRLKVLEQSELDHLMYYCEENTPHAIAEAVKSIDFTQPYDSREVLKQLDEKFIEEIGTLLR